MPLLSLSHVGKHFGAEPILHAVTFRIERAEHAALVGVNGAGKSTLLRIIAGLEEADSGAVNPARGLRVVYLPQEPEFDPEGTLYEAMLETFADAIAAGERLRVLESEMAAGPADPDLVEEYGRLQALVEHTGYDYGQQIERVLTGLGLTSSSWYTATRQLSGGQRTRANLARTLLQDADLLLLDEPTNHLDIPAVEWLEGYLRDLKRAFIVVAHDRYLLDRVTTRTLELSGGRLTAYDAPYSRYLDLKAERLERQKVEYEAQQRQIAKTEDFIRRYGAGQRSREARGRQKRLDRLERAERPQEEGAVSLGLHKAKRSGDIVLTARRLEVGYEGKPLIRLPEEVVVRRSEKIAIIGPNGSGKTTMLRTLIGALPPVSGEVHWGANTNIGYYSQTLGQLEDRNTVLDEIGRVRAMAEEEARSYLGRFLFTADDVFKTIGVLSGGEKSRVALAKLILEQPNVLVLDEPTNHLDITSRDALQAVLDPFAGTMLFVSHDRALIDALSDELWVVGDGTLTRYGGNYSDYKSGTAQPLDRPRADKASAGGSPIERIAALGVEAEALAGRLSSIGAAAALGQLAELSDRYAETAAQLQEAQDAWIRNVHRQVRAFSESPAQSGAEKPQ